MKSKRLERAADAVIEGMKQSNEKQKQKKRAQAKSRP